MNKKVYKSLRKQHEKWLKKVPPNEGDVLVPLELEDEIMYKLFLRAELEDSSFNDFMVTLIRRQLENYVS